MQRVGKTRAQHQAAHVVGPAPVRRGIVPRTRLVERLLEQCSGGVVAVLAPAGYGKTTLLAQWAKADPRPVAWLTLDRADNDPTALLARLAATIEAAAIPGAVRSAMPSVAADEAVTRGVFRLVASLRDAAPALLVLDGVDAVTSRASRDLIAEMATRLPPTVTLVVAARTQPPVPVATLRAQGALHEVTAADLAMSRDEARELFIQEGVDTGQNLADVVARSEGWPAALYLMALAVKSGADWDSVVGVSGDDRFLADYLQAEFLSRLSSARREFLTMTSILDELTGPLCDHVLGVDGSMRTLHALETSNLLVVPLDRTRTWYRYHALLRDHLHAELLREDPATARDLHGRAAEWFETEKKYGLAIHHAECAGDAETAARLIASVGRTLYATGGSATVLAWLRWFEESNQIERFPELAVVGALACALEGDDVGAERWASVVPKSEDARSRPLVHMLRAVFASRGAEQAGRDAEAGAGMMDRDSDWYPAMSVIRALTAQWNGRVDQADEELRLAAPIAEAGSALPAATYAMASRASIALERGDVDAACDHAFRSVEIIRHYGIGLLATSCLSFVVAARCSLRRGDAARAGRLVAESTGARARLSRALPGVALQSLLETATTLVELADVAGAREVMREVAKVGVGDFGALSLREAALREQLAAMPAGDVGPSTLTSAELRLLPYLVTHLSFPEIGERLFVSRHTVKTQAMSIYRKLGVSSRSEAVATARDLGLLGS